MEKKIHAAEGRYGPGPPDGDDTGPDLAFQQIVVRPATKPHRSIKARMLAVTSEK